MAKVVSECVQMEPTKLYIFLDMTKKSKVLLCVVVKHVGVPLTIKQTGRPMVLAQCCKSLSLIHI